MTNNKSNIMHSDFSNKSNIMHSEFLYISNIDLNVHIPFPWSELNSFVRRRQRHAMLIPHFHNPEYAGNISKS